MGHNGMGGMFTIVKIREHLDSYGDPGWYEHPPGTAAPPRPRVPPATAMMP